MTKRATDKRRTAKRLHSQGKTYAEIGAELGVSRQRASQLVNVPLQARRAIELGVSDDDYRRLLAAQGGRCAICRRPPKTRRLHADHDHNTGVVRGLLCYRCNRALPTWIDIPWLEKAATYLRSNGHMQHA